MDSKGYYKTLGVGENASDDEIKKSFRKLSLKFHPDKQANKSDKEKKDAEAKFKEVNEAYQVLSDPEKRKQYDRGTFNFGSAGSSGFNTGFDFGDFNFDEFGFNGAGFDFSQFFGGRQSGRSYKQSQQAYKRPPEKGTDIRMTIPITLEEIFTGCTKKIKYSRNVKCPVCHGAGGTNKHTCPDCNGTGVKRIRTQSMFGFVESTTVCPKCNGKGYITDDTCKTCNGTGLKREEVIQEVTFAPGMLEDYAIKYDGKGNQSRDTNGVNGDFYAICKHVYDKTKYQIINNNDIYEKIEIPYYDALLGCEYILEKPDHKKIKVTIPSCIENGKQGWTIFREIP